MVDMQYHYLQMYRLGIRYMRAKRFVNKVSNIAPNQELPIYLTFCFDKIFDIDC
jgi:hypothetical protein